MKSNLLHICFILDESSSMHSSIDNVINGFQKLIDEQKQLKNGECIVSVYRFATKVKSDFVGKSLNEISSLEYSPKGCTAMYDGIGTAIDEIGEWLSDMKEECRPSKNLIVIMTDGEENNSHKYTFKDIKDRIKHQEEKYNWSFVYMGTDLRSLDDAKSLGIRLSSVSDRGNILNNYHYINTYATSYRNSTGLMDIQEAEVSLSSSLNVDTTRYFTETRMKIK